MSHKRTTDSSSHDLKVVFPSRSTFYKRTEDVLSIVLVETRVKNFHSNSSQLPQRKRFPTASSTAVCLGFKPVNRFKRCFPSQSNASLRLRNTHGPADMIVWPSFCSARCRRHDGLAASVVRNLRSDTSRFWFLLENLSVEALCHRLHLPVLLGWQGGVARSASAWEWTRREKTTVS